MGSMNILALVGAFAGVTACSSGDSDDSGGAGRGGSGGSSAAGGSSGAAGSAGGGDGGPVKSDAALPGAGCVTAGGMCGCAGGCDVGYHEASGPLLFDCPQPCAECGSCGQQCCLPDVPEAGTDAGCSGDFSCLCGDAVCVDGAWECQGDCSDGG